MTKKKPVLNAYILLDKSGSMASRWKEAISSINAYVDGLKMDSKITVATFNSITEMDFNVIRHMTSGEWREISANEARPNGNTPLYDAIAKLVAMAEKYDEDRSIIIIVTDGEENSSREITREGARMALDRCRQQGWQVVFMGADFDAFKQGEQLGILRGQTITMASGNYESAMRGAAAHTKSYVASGQAVAWSDNDREKALKK